MFFSTYGCGEIGAFRGRRLFALPAKHLAARSIDEVKPAARLALHGFIGGVRIFRIWFVRQPVLHVQTGPRTLEDYITHGAGDYCRLPVGSVLISINVRAAGMCQPATRCAVPAMPVPLLMGDRAFVGCQAVRERYLDWQFGSGVAGAVSLCAGQACENRLNPFSAGGARARSGGYSLSVIRIRPSPETTGPLAVTTT